MGSNKRVDFNVLSSAFVFAFVWEDALFPLSVSIFDFIFLQHKVRLTGMI